MKLVTYIIYLLIIIFINGCSYPHFYYSPNSHNVPLFTGKNDFSVNTVGSLGAVNGALELQAALSMPANLALTANFMTGGNKHRISEVTDLSRVGYFEGGAGVYTSLGKKGVFEFYGGFGKGKQHHDFAYREYDGWFEWHWIEDGTADLSFTKFYIQPDIGFKLEGFEGAFSCRFTRLNYLEIDFRNTEYRLDNFYSLRNNPDPWLIEPAFTLRGGKKSVKFQVQILTSRSLSGSPELFEIFRFGFGLHFNIKERPLPDKSQF